MAIIPHGSTILVTGASGYLGTHIVDQLLSRGYNVRGTVRSAEKGEALTAVLSKIRPEAQTAFSYHIVPDMAVAGAHGDAVKGVTEIIHVASDLSFSNDPEKVVNGVVNAAKDLLVAAKRAGTVRRFVLTSTITAAGPFPGKAGEIWNRDSAWTETLQLAWKKDDDPMIPLYCYVASKLQTEMEAKRFIAEEAPGFDLNIIRPNYMCGTIMDPTKYSTTGTMMHTLFHRPENERNTAFVKQIFGSCLFYVDIQDAARLHVAALILDDVSGETIYAATIPTNLVEVLDIFKRWDASKAWPVVGAEAGRMPEVVIEDLQSGKLKTLLNRIGVDDFTDLETSLRRCIHSA